MISKILTMFQEIQFSRFEVIKYFQNSGIFKI